MTMTEENMSVAEKVDIFSAEVESQIKTRLKICKDIIPTEICVSAFEKAGFLFSSEREAQGGMKAITNGMSMDAYVKRRHIMNFYLEMLEWSQYNERKARAKLGPSYSKKIKDVFDMSPKALFDKKDFGLYEEPLSWNKLSDGSRQSLKNEEKTFMNGYKGRDYNKDAEAADLCDIYGLNYIEEGLAKEISKKYDLDIRDVFGYISSYVWRYTASNNPEDESRDVRLVKDLKSEDVIYMYFTCKLSHNDIWYILYRKAKNLLEKDIKDYSPDELEKIIIEDNADIDYEDIEASNDNLYSDGYYDDMAYIYEDTITNFEYDWECGDAEDCLECFYEELGEAEEEYLYEQMMEEAAWEEINASRYEQGIRESKKETHMLRLLSKDSIPVEIKMILTADYSDVKQVPQEIMERLTNDELNLLQFGDLTPAEVIINDKIYEMISKYGLIAKIQEIIGEYGIGDRIRKLFSEPAYDPRGNEVGHRDIDDFIALSNPNLMFNGYNAEEQVLLEKIGIRNPNVFYVAARKIGIDYNDALKLIADLYDIHYNFSNSLTNNEMPTMDESEDREKLACNLEYEIDTLRRLYCWNPGMESDKDPFYRNRKRPMTV